jgi:hypothetical protein
MVDQKIKITPIYGYGWVIAGKPRFKVPDPFSVRLDQFEEIRWAGIVVEPGHEFEGSKVALSQRHREWSGHVNIEVHPPDKDSKSSIGYGTLEARPSSPDH